MSKPHLGMIGLAVMGSNLARNIESRGFACAVFNRDTAVTDEFMKKFGSGQFVASKSLPEFVSSMAEPRQIFIMIKAGAPVDAVIDSLIPLLSKGDIIVDGGNSYYPDTVRREKKCKDAGMNFLGLGVSGGEEGALKGPSLMPGGPRDAFQIMKPVLEKIAAKVDGTPCTTYIGPDGSGHFVKMVHNGIEYADMQLIAEAYDLLRKGIDAKPKELAGIFESWNEGDLSSFLIEITAKIFKKNDDQGDGFLVDKIMDKAGSKGTGKWTVQSAAELAVAIPGISAAVDARILSSLKDERLKSSKEFPAPNSVGAISSRAEYVNAVRDALYCSKILSYAQGMALFQAASAAWNWDLKLNEIATIWRGGCIIRARFLNDIKLAYERNPKLANMVLDPEFKKKIMATLPNLRRVVQIAVERGIPVPAFSASLSYFDAYCAAELPHNLTQAQRDFFGAHTYERRDKTGSFHSQWE